MRQLYYTLRGDSGDTCQCENCGRLLLEGYRSIGAIPGHLEAGSLTCTDSWPRSHQELMFVGHNESCRPCCLGRVDLEVSIKEQIGADA